jgi:F-type H+-transporting ATPase subunit a
MGTIEISIFPEKIFEIFNLPITGTFFLSLILGAFLFFLFFFGLKIASGRLRAFSEWVLESFLNYIEGVVGEKEKAKEIFPLVCTLFLFILFANLLEILPGVGVFHFFRSPSSDLSFTLPLAIFSMGYIHFHAIQKLGLFSHLKKFLNFKNPILFFVGILEGISQIVRTFSLAIRLFGNLFAGEILLIVTSHLFPFLLPLPFLLLEIFVSFIQALIFSTLVAIFYAVETTKAE